jgi:hypothetical protein
MSDSSPDLLQALTDPRAAARRGAVRVLGDLSDAAPMLIEHLATERDASVRRAGFSSLIRIGNRDAIAGLIGYLRSDDATLRNGALDALASDPARVSEIVGTLLRDPDPDVRIMSLATLLHQPDAEERLIGVISSDRSVVVCCAAVDQLGEIATSAARPALSALKLRFAEEPFIQFAADAVLSRIDAAA